MLIEERVDRLEIILGQFMTETGVALLRIDRAIERLENTTARLENTTARLENTTARIEKTMEQMGKTMEQMGKTIEQMGKTIERMEREGARDRREWNKRWGEMSNRLGTIVEDIIAPSLRRIAVEELGCGAERFFAVRLVKTRADDPGTSREFDALFVGRDALLLNETKATARPEYAREFVSFVQSGEFLLYFPEYKHLPIVPVFSALSLPADLVTYLTSQGIYAVAMGDEAMQVLNLEQVKAAP